MSTERVHAIIVTYNPELSILERQLNSLMPQVKSIVLVDNASANQNSINLLLKQYPSAKLIFNHQNLGLGKAQNIGINDAKSNGATDIILFDQDSILNIDCVAELVKARLEIQLSKRKIAAVGPLYFNELSGKIYPISKYFGPFIRRFVPIEKPTEASFLIASGCLINLVDLVQIGHMNEELFIDYIDIEWCFRAKNMGYGLYAVPKALMVHAIGDNSFAVAGREISNHSPLRRYYLCRNSIFMIKNGNIPIGYKLREIVVNLIRLITFFIFSSDRKRYWKYSLRGFIDGFKNIGGMCPHSI